MPTDRSPLGAFLRSRRDRLTPAQAGIDAFPGPRRVPGLRKEELAVLAGLSPDHYSRLEQGRQHTVTDDVVDALSRALQLDDLEAQHLRNLAAPTSPRRRVAPDLPVHADPGMLRLMAQLDQVPTLLLGPRSEVLAGNGLLREVLGWSAEPGASFARWLLLDPGARERITNWDDFAASAVGALRYDVGRRPDDRRLTALVRELRDGDPDVARWWDDQGVTFRTSLTKKVAHPVAGPLVFGIESVVGPHDPDQRLVVYTVESDSPTARVLPLLANWAAPIANESL
ncbi:MULTISPECIES: helix-turn-helix transcriptional regulator [unclassified Allobranchiibius]|uniref:helix-turn-helix transcriptional regulator n=1 Tax=unclassified Allobranchiibius TaxID=2649857 RepID=UPI001AA1A1B3|nr:MULTISPECIES: helix-turn-helix transcriptional regulator [unclassified Allobranchiibius]MBO1768366.1 helix-turn-helix domain-containing protein [Allobranchiibius sp. GilTou38]UIJ35514.1 helix-turn-helix transcriptional regulator [Allobranchiibius sp. GilTou73]